MMAFLRDLVGRLRPKAVALAVRVTDENITVLEGDRQCWQVGWDDIQEIVTFKLDLLTYDDIRLAFRVDDLWVELSEDAEGWSTLSSALARRFPTIPTDWYKTVIFPPFATCYRVLYERRLETKCSRCWGMEDSGYLQNELIVESTKAIGSVSLFPITDDLE